MTFGTKVVSSMQMMFEVLFPKKISVGKSGEKGGEREVVVFCTVVTVAANTRPMACTCLPGGGCAMLLKQQCFVPCNGSDLTCLYYNLTLHRLHKLFIIVSVYAVVQSLHMVPV